MLLWNLAMFLINVQYYTIPDRNIYLKTTILETKDFFNFTCIFIKQKTECTTIMFL